MYVCIHTHICIYMYKYIYTHTNTYIHTYKHSESESICMYVAAPHSDLRICSVAAPVAAPVAAGACYIVRASSAAQRSQDM